MSIPKLGLCCLTSDKQISYRTITKTNFDKLSNDEQIDKLTDIYTSNVHMFVKAIVYCANNGIPMYRVTSLLFPFHETEAGKLALANSWVTEGLMALGHVINHFNIRVVMHPDQFVVLSSDNPDTVTNSIRELQHHADTFDKIGLSLSHKNLINIHGGKRGNLDKLIGVVNALPNNIKSRLTFENDEHSYGVKDLAKLSKKTGIPILFDYHHSLIFNQLSTYNARQIVEEHDIAKTTWGKEAEWFTTHISNGTVGLLDRKHSDFISIFPHVMREANWVEVEARMKEQAIFQLRELLAA